MGTVTGPCSPASVKSPSLLRSRPLSVSSTPFVTVVEPVIPVSDAVQVLERVAALNTSSPEGLMLLMVAVLVADPVGPGVPTVLTSMAPELKMIPYLPESAWAVMGVADPVGGSETAGVGGWVPKKLVLAE
jgi:hypothetical protein